MMRIMGMEPTSEQLNTLVESIDVDGNGKIELPEFANMMARQMLLRDGKVRRAAASAHLTHSPHRGAHSLERLPGALWCCAVLCCAARGTLAPAAWRERPRQEAACTLVVAAC